MKLRRILALALALVMVMACSVTAFAATGSTGEVTITNPKEGDTYKFYRVLDLDYTAAAGSDPASFAYTINEDFEDFFAAVTPALDTIPTGMPNAGKVSPAAAYDYIVRQMNGVPAVLYTQADVDAYEADPANAGVPCPFTVGATKTPAVAARPAAFAAELAKYAQDNSVAHKYTTDGTTAKIEDVDYGYYLMIPNVATNNGVVMFSLSSIAPNVTITNKSTYPTLTKTVTDSDETDKTSNTASVGDELVFELTSSVPNRDGYATFDFKFEDTMTNLTYVAGSVKLTVGGTEVVIPTANLTWDATGKKLTVVVPEMLSYTTGAAIVLQYKATVDAAAAEGGLASNSAKLTYSNDPNDATSTTSTPTTTVETYVLKVVLNKVKSNGTALTGSTWKLEQKINGSWVEVKGDAVTATADQTSKANGRAVITANDPAFTWAGLGAGTYRFIETKAPNSYNIIEAPIEFTLAATMNADDELTGVTFTAEHDYIKGTPTASVTGSLGTVSLNVQNLTASELPGTGGIGVGILVAVAAVSAGAFIFLMYRKKRSASAE